MRAVLSNLGSMGDVQPLLALAVELERHGHRAVLALPPYYRGHVESLGLGFAPVGPEMDFAEIDRGDAERLVRGEDPLVVMRDSLARLEGLLPRLFAELRAVCRDADVLIGGHLQPACQMIHELAGTPFVSVQVNHFGGTRAPAERAALAGVINPFRERYGLPPLADPLYSDANSPQLALYAISRHLRLPEADRPRHHHVTGFFFLGDGGWQPGPELAGFLAAGEPPVVVSFSSMTHGDPEAVTEVLLAAIARAGCRAVIQAGWSGLARRSGLPPGVLAARFVPHAWLFPRAACVVHHGGAQTSAAVLRAGVPSVVVPHVRDQPVWAQLLHGLGCATRPLAFDELSAERLAAAIEEARRDPRRRRAAAELGERVRAERGVERARQLVEELVDRLRRRERAAPAVPEGREGRLSRRRIYQQEQRWGRQIRASAPGIETES